MLHTRPQSIAGERGGTWDAAGSAGLEGPLPLLPPHAAHDGRDSRKRLLATCRCCSSRRSGLVPEYGAATALLALSPLTTGVINAWKEGRVGGCWCCVDDVTRCYRRQFCRKETTPIGPLLSMCQSPPGRDERDERGETRGCGRDVEEREKKNSTATTRSRPGRSCTRDKAQGAGATSILVVSSMPKTRAELESKGEPSLFAQ